MNTALHDADERTNLTGNNKFEMLLFRLGDAQGTERRELFGINVFKVREILVMPTITAMANAPAHVLGVANIRGQIIPVIDLPAAVGCVPKRGLTILLVTEYARTTQAFAVEEVDEIVRLNWSDVLAAEGNGGSLVTSIAKLDGDTEKSRLVQVLDVEQILRNVMPRAEEVITPESVGAFGEAAPWLHHSCCRRLARGAHDDRAGPDRHGHALCHDQDRAGGLGPPASH